MPTQGAKLHPLPRAGTRRADRLVRALDPATLRLEDRGTCDWLEFGSKLAAHIRFQHTLDKSPADAEANWQPFFSAFDFPRYDEAPEAFEEDFARFRQSPHGGLYTVYLRWLERVRDDLNGLSGKHLEFYYRHVLGLKPRAAGADRVHVVFEPARNKHLIRVPIDTRLNAGKTLTYVTANEIFVGQARVEALHSIFADAEQTDRPRLALQANSLDGYGEPLTDDAPNWKPFGSQALPPMEVGFAIASPILALKEGERTIRITINLRAAGTEQTLPGDDALKAGLSVECSGADDWLGPFAPEAVSAIRLSGDEVKLVLTVHISAAEDPVDFYDVGKLEGGYDTVSPIVKVMLDESADPDVYRLLANASLKSVDIGVDVVGAKELDLENDFGRLNPDKPFFPFGPQPVKGGSFYVSSEEMLAKQVTDFKLKIKWQDAPESLAKRYAAYLESKIHLRYPKLTADHLKPTYDRYVKNNSHFKATMSLSKRGREETTVTVQLFDKDDAREPVVFNRTPAIRPPVLLPYLEIARYFSRVTKIVKAQFPGAVRMISRPTTPISRRRRRRLFKSIDRRIRLPFKGRRQFRVRQRKFGVIQVTLLQGFFHRIYPHYLSATIADEDSTVSPQEPYTPVIESLELDYSASVRYDAFDDDDLGKYNRKSIQIFQLTAFGHAEQHAFLKGDLPFVDDKRARLLPHDEPAGSLVLGIRGLEERESISMLVQVAPGTANPMKERQDVQWSVLVRNHWRPFESSELLIDETNALLTSGIVRLQMPGEPLHDNTLYNPDLTWLRASAARDADAVCDFRQIHLHAVSARVEQVEGGNAVQGSIQAETIAKLRAPIAAIKSVSQPYDSFGGQPPEADLDFYRRVSERLRHKQRAVTAADYERLVLDQFPELHMVRCLSHTDAQTCAAPGHVTLVVVPRTPPEARFDRLRPRADLDTISRIGDFVNTLNTHQFTAQVVNPAYEEVRLAFAVRFMPDRPFPPYREILNEDLVKFLSPWVAKVDVMPAFGGRMYKSQIVKFIEELEYVDFVSDVKLLHGAGSTADRMSIQPSVADGILVSASTHAIEEAEVRA